MAVGTGIGVKWWTVTYKSKVDSPDEPGVKVWMKETHEVYTVYSNAAACAMRRHMKPLGEKMTLRVEASR